MTKYRQKLLIGFLLTAPQLLGLLPICGKLEDPISSLSQWLDKLLDRTDFLTDGVSWLDFFGTGPLVVNSWPHRFSYSIFLSSFGHRLQSRKEPDLKPISVLSDFKKCEEQKSEIFRQIVIYDDGG